MQKRQCRACRKMFVPRAGVRDQSFCENELCQKERRRRWQQGKRRRDADYRDNERRAQRDWAKRNPDYWKEYRRTHPDYAERNRQRQRERDRQRRDEGSPGVLDLANGDASKPIVPLPSGTYVLKPVAGPRGAMLANEDVWHVQIAVLPTP